jgi:hypothetical protein
MDSKTASQTAMQISMGGHARVNLKPYKFQQICRTTRNSMRTENREQRTENRQITVI